MDKIKDWLYFNDDLKYGVSIILVFFCCYLYFTKSFQTIDSDVYNIEGELIDYEFKKIYALPELYSTKRKLAHIIIDIEYTHDEKNYESTAIIYWVNITPQFEQIIENKELDKLIVKCSNESPEQAMIFLKD